MVRIGRLVALVALGFSAYWGLTNGARVWAAGESMLQKGVGAGQLLYGILGVLGIAAMWFRPHQATRVAAAWAVVLTATALLAALAWPAPLGAAVMVVAMFACIGWIVVWMVAQGTPADADSIEAPPADNPS